MKFRHGVIFTLTLALSAAFAPAYAQTETQAETQTGVHQLDIQAQPLSGALKALADQTGVQVVFFSEVTQGLQAPAVSGDYTIEQALDSLLTDTGLVYEYLGEDGQSVTVREPSPSVGQRQQGIEEIIVTGQKREERIQDVPIAISAFSAEDLEAQKIEGGFDLLKGVPNVTFTKTNFTGYNFQIRGIGTQAVSATTDPGVAVSFNNTTLIVNRLFEQEYLDVERVEVLRGPQGTLFGRNATAGVINVITNKPEMGVTDAMIDVEVGNYNARRLRGFFNLPIGDEWAVRGAYASTKRDGYATNEFDGSAIDGRDLWTGRLSIGWQPTDRFRANFIWERFEEDDDRLRSAKNLCHRDEGPDQVGDLDVTEHEFEQSIRRVVQQGCVPGSLYSDDAYDTPNGDAMPFVTVGRVNSGIIYTTPVGMVGANPFSDFNAPCPTAEPNGFGGAGPNAGLMTFHPCKDVFANRQQSRDLRTIYSPIQPEYRAEADIYEFSFDYDWTDSLTFSSQTVYAEDEVFSTQDFTRFEPGAGFFMDTAEANTIQSFEDFAPGGVFCDPQLGCSDRFIAQDISQSESTQFNQEFRLVSSFAGDWNFSLGANYTNFETQADYFLFSNLLTALTQVPPFDGPGYLSFFLSDPPLENDFNPWSTCSSTGVGCVSIQQEGLRETAENPYGHNFFLSSNPYELTSYGLFGELYWQATDTVKVTAGLRYTWDRKVFSPIPSQTLLRDFREGGPYGNPSVSVGGAPQDCLSIALYCAIAGNAPGGRGYPANPDIVQTWNEPTGRLVVDWQPLLDFTDETLVYASFSHGYKGGGANPPTVAPPAGLFIERAQGAVSPKTFEPEFINAYEVGTKNTLFGGALVLNGTAFYYDYTDYQVSKIVDRSAANENFDAKLWGLELETVFAPTLDWQFNAAIGYLNTEIARGERSIDLMDRTNSGGKFFITRIDNPDFDGDVANARPESEYVAGLGAPEDQQFLAFEDWMVVKQNVVQASNCVAPVDLIEDKLVNSTMASGVPSRVNGLCPGGTLLGGVPNALDETLNVETDMPNGGAGFFKDIGGNALPNAPEFTVSLGGQYSFDVVKDWRATARVDYYWQDQSYARVYNTEYDRLRSWSNTNLSFWMTSPSWGVTVEAYVKNVFDESPITGTFLNSDDTALTTNVFTLDPRLIGVSVRKEF